MQLNIENKVNTIKNTATSEAQLNFAYQSWKVEEEYIKSVEEFIRVLEKGKIVLEYIRQFLTGQKIKTEFILRTSDNNIISTNSDNVSYSYVLSTYGASGNNYVSLAYHLDSTIGQTISNLREDRNKKIINIANKIGKKEVDYNVIQQKMLAVKEKIYKTVYFDSKDAEIFYKLLNTPSTIKNLTPTIYKKYRSQMGGGGGIKTTALQAGDIGDTQIKLFSNRTVNVMRQTMIIDTFKKLDQELIIRDKKRFKDFLYQNFTSKNKNTDFSIDKAFSTEARKGIDQIVKQLDLSNFN